MTPSTPREFRNATTGLSFGRKDGTIRAIRVDRDHPEECLLTEVHRRKRHLLFDHVGVNVLQLGDVDAQHLDEQQEDSHNQEGHDEVDEHVGKHRDAGAGHGSECRAGDQLSAHEGEERLTKGHAQEHADEEELPECVVAGDAHGLNQAQRDRPHDDQAGDRANQSGQNEAAQVEDRQEDERTTSEDLTGKQPLADVQRVADFVHCAEQDHSEEGQQYGVVTNGLHPHAIEASIATNTGDGDEEQTQERRPQSADRGPGVNHHQERTDNLHAERGDGAGCREHPREQDQDREADDDVNPI